MEWVSYAPGPDDGAVIAEGRRWATHRGRRREAQKGTAKAMGRAAELAAFLAVEAPPRASYLESTRTNLAVVEPLRRSAVVDGG